MASIVKYFVFSKIGLQSRYHRLRYDCYDFIAMSRGLSYARSFNGYHELGLENFLISFVMGL